MKIFAFIFALTALVYAESDFSYMMGMRKNKYAFLGVMLNSRYGFLAENSILSQGVEKQYARLYLFYAWEMPLGISGRYSFFGGARYDGDYYDYGARLDAQWVVIDRHLKLEGAFEPFFDSFFKERIGYEIGASCFLHHDFGIRVGVRNLPDFRNVEQRVFAGLFFDTEKVYVLPEVSAPLNGDTHLLRVSISFIYQNKL